ncbi:hydrolase, carbon-nitrogen [Pseudozyma hubeiensis SY62]|uniref:Hydrolase, carbon-nitrogen n=1 Tax=Pseudozyma hubeiensis (strain SY62) TaxID=1305764 RepID=R9PEH8_PSEHS|nr:hydrolase, carbon-nitrogen [Pseudozyma hubeiensis SY62]GAC99662.1 hydrolase, carbon-nitrogen [Pseudozyma hubeiensis SY62]
MVLAAVAQLKSTSVIADNLAASVSLIRSAALAGAKAIFLPEATDFIAPTAQVASLTRSQDNATFVQGIQSAAKEAAIWVSVGIHEPPSAQQDEKDSADNRGRLRCYNTQLLIDQTGAILDRYRKLHLFDVDIKGGLKILESDSTIKGNELLTPRQTPLVYRQRSDSVSFKLLTLFFFDPRVVAHSDIQPYKPTFCLADIVSLLRAKNSNLALDRITDKNLASSSASHCH